MVHFSNPENEDPMESLRKRRFFLEYLIAHYKENYIPEEHLVIDKYLTLWKGQLSFRAYIPTKREQYGIKIFMLYTNTEYPDQPDPLPMKFDEYKSPSNMTHDYMTHDYTSPELAVLASCNTDCYCTLQKKQSLPNQYWEWKRKKGDLPKSQFKGEVGIMWWNDASKMKSVKFEVCVSMLSTIHTIEMVDSNKINRTAAMVIQKPDVIMDYNVTMGGVDLVSKVLILYSSQQHRVN